MRCQQHERAAVQIRRGAVALGGVTTGAARGERGLFMATTVPESTSAPLGTAAQRLARRNTARLPQRRFAVGGLIIAVAIAYLIISSFSSAVSSVLSPGQLLGRGGAAYGQTVRLQGQVVGADSYDKRT